jgi:predicted nucleic acid-binding protein
VRLALDTNVMAYAEGLILTEADRAKNELALLLLDRAADEELVLARQTLAELHSVLVRKLRLSPIDAAERVWIWAERAEAVDTDEAVFQASLDLSADHGLQIFDAIILAAAAEARCELLLSEDLQDGFAFRGVVVTNPFGPAPDRRLRRLMEG